MKIKKTKTHPNLFVLHKSNSGSESGDSGQGKFCRHFLKKIGCAPALFLFFSLISTSCSLNYAKEEDYEDIIPEFTFSKASFLRFEKSNKTMEMTAEKIEQYKTSGQSVAKQAEFHTYDAEKKPQTDGSCELISADTKNEKYVLLGNIYLKIFSQNTEIYAESLRIDNKSEQITSGTDDEVTIAKNDTEITGKGFSASSLSNSFLFTQEVSGIIETDSEQEEKTDAQ